MPSPRRLERGEALALIISVLLVAASAFLLVVGDAAVRRTAVATLVFFGAGVALFAGVWLRRGREARSRGARSVSIVGGVPLRARVGRLVALALGLIVVGAVYGWGFARHGWLGWILGGIQIASGVLLLGVVVLRGRTRGLCFEPDALHLIDGGIAFCLPWDEIAGVGQVELHSNAFVALQLHDVERALSYGRARRRDGSDGTEALRRVFARSRAWGGADAWIPAELYGLDAALLTAAIRRYVEQPAARAELGVRPLAEAA